MYFSSRNWRGGRRLYIFAVFITLNLVLATFSAAVVPTVKAQTPADAPVDQAAPKEKDPCKAKKLKKVEKVKDAIYCMHGSDPAPAGKDSAQDVAPMTTEANPISTAVACEGDGVSGPRVQVIYARASDVSDRYTTYLTSFQQWAAAADRIFQDSAAETGGHRYIRFVHDSACNPVVARAVLSPSGDDTFGNTINELRALGYNRTDRKYMIFMDANVYCGIGNIWNDDQSSASNANNFGPSYGRTDAGCWSGTVAAHELMHNLGGVQLSAPNTSGGWHCVDEYDVMCYSDSPYYPPMQYRCTDIARDATRFDCNHEDYYHTNPPANSYLATHWNTANSQYLAGGVAPPPCPDAAFEPDNSLAQARSVAVGSTERHAFCVAGDEDWVYFPASAGTAYRIETLNLTSGTDTILYLYNSSGTLVASNDDRGDGTLTSLINYTPATSGNYYVRAIQFGGNGSTGFQYDLRISGTAPPPPGNLLRNGSFDDDANSDNRPDNWTSKSQFTRSSAVPRCTTTAYVGRFSATDNSGVAISQRVSSLTAGTTYNFSGCVNIPAQNDGTFAFKIQVQWKNSSNSTISTTTVKNYTVATGGWNQATKSVTAPAGTASAVVKMVARSLNGNIYVDDFVFGR